MKTIAIKRIYDAPSDNDGYRILVDRVWPRGVSKQDAKLDDWMKAIAPSHELRKWFHHDPQKFDEFDQRYRHELEKKSEELEALRKMAKSKKVTLLYSAKDKNHNQAIVLQGVLQKK